MKVFLLVLMSIVYLDSCKANDSVSIVGKWKVTKAVNIISVDKNDWLEYQSACLGAMTSINIVGDNIQIEMNEKCDQDGNFTLSKLVKVSKSLPVKSKERKDIMIADIMFKSKVVYVNKPFLSIIGEDGVNKHMQGFNTNMHISWGEETLKIFSVNKNKIVFYFYAYMLVLERE